MSFIESPSRELGDDLDGQLRAFFRSRMPHPWPSAPTPRKPNESPAPRRHNLYRARFALAASLALLMLGSLLLPNRLSQDGKSMNALEGETIGNRDLRRKMEREHKMKEFENKNKIGFDADGEGLGMLDVPFVR